ncbi:MAG: hypothetical protein AAF722_15510 [Cyanobacteria bacterium P01_C01_bin.70]
MSSCRHALQSIGQQFACRCLTHSWSLSLKLSGGAAIALTALLSAPLVAQAYTARVTLFVTRNNDESYEIFLRQCEAIARAGVQRSFDADVLASEVVLTIVGENQGLALPIMEVEVTRTEWQERPDPQYWARYYNNASTLLDSDVLPPSEP